MRLCALCAQIKATVMRIPDPESTALLFENGKILIKCNRPKDEIKALKDAARACITAIKLSEAFKDTMAPPSHETPVVRSITGACNVGFKISLEKMALACYEEASLEPLVFKGLIWPKSVKLCSFFRQSKV